MSGGRLSEVLREAADEVTGYDVLANAIARGRRRRRRAAAFATGAAMAAVAMVATPVLLLRPQPPAPQAASSPTAPSPPSPPGATVGTILDLHAADRPDFYFTVAAGPVAGYEIRPVSVSVWPDRQFAYVVPAGGAVPVSHLELASPGENVTASPWLVRFGGFPSFDDPDAEPNAQVHGTPAFLAVTADWSAVLWQHAPDAEAMLSSVGTDVLSGQILLEIAEGLRFVDPYPARVPFRLDYLPADLPAYNLSAERATRSTTVQFGHALGDNGRGMDIVVSDDPEAFLEINPEYQEWAWEPVTIAGRDGRCADLIDGRRCEVSFGEVIVGLGSGSLTSAELDQIVAGLHLASLDDPATWYDIDGAIPGL